MQPAQELEKLMVQYQQGDAAAVTALVQRLSPQLHRFFLAQFASRRHADDLLQETWLRIHRVRHTYRPGEPLLPWLYAVARNVRVDHYRKARRVEERERQVESLPEPAANPEGAGAPERGRDVAAMLRELPESQREVLVMLKVAGMSIEEVARATGSSVGSVKQKAHRAYEKLRRLYEA
jgi:RNA polymerase sigma-70 factor (ECF subfamily)